MNNEIKPSSAKNEESDHNKNNIPPFYNSHTHIFNFSHVHKHFLKGMIPLSVSIIGIVFLVGILMLNIYLLGAKNFSWFIIFVYLLSVVLVSLLLFFLYVSLLQPKLNRILKSIFFRRIIKRLAKLSSKSYDSIGRYANLILHSYNLEKGKVKSQEDIFKNLQSYYPKNTKFVTLSMDMDYMVNFNNPKGGLFLEQLQEIEKIKINPIYKNKIYPFIHVDPRRLNNDSNFYEIVEKYINAGTFQGLKIYPALGYFPFDRRLKVIYDLALKHNLPITTHCSMGPVFYRGKVKDFESEIYYDAVKRKFIHPFTGNELLGKNAKEFTSHFSHPLNYYCLMSMPDKLFEFWKKCDELSDGKLETDYNIDNLEKYKNLKFCLGHYGGSEEWGKYLKDAWLPEKGSALTVDENLLHLPNGEWIHKKDGMEADKAISYSWHSIISDMLGLKDETGKQPMFPNLFSDISYNLSNKEVLPLLKVRLESNKQIAKKILFGTDFFMVSTEASEREITMNIRSFIGEKNFDRIARENPLNFLSSECTSKDTLKKV